MPSGKTSPENTWQRIEYWVKRNPDKTLEECQELLNKYKKEKSFQCIEYWIKKYPDKTLEECQEMLDNAKKSYLKKRPDGHGENNPAHKSKVPLEERKRRSPMTIEFWKSKNPDKSLEECQELLNLYKEKLKKTHTPENTNTRIEYWLSKGYSEEEAKEILRNRQSTFTLKKCIDKYGKEEGEKIFNDRQKKWLTSLKNQFNKGGISQSEWARNIIKELKKYIQDIETEYIIKKYSFDLKFKNKLIELNGDYFHCNPKLYDKNFYNKIAKQTAENIWKKDKNKKELAIKNGFSLLTIWESDWNEDPQRELNKCLEFLND